MTRFKSSREKRMWLGAGVAAVTIFITLFIGNPLAGQLRNQNIQAVFFVLGMVLVGIAILIHGIRTKPNRVEWILMIGSVALVVMLYVRLGIPERSHMIEYGVLSIFVYSALQERATTTNPKLKPALQAILLAFFIGVMDESIQLLLPYRVFDFQDILFNGMVVVMAIVGSSTLSWVRRRFSGNSKGHL
ncbi:VanZ family protein [Ekhidna sp. MALMAid0563]|uniref:VanZ family protein n=1 Tax=Ekhidna sp. MALMAid0563 TaxID=3143937 RepID=UPI0032E04C2C